jgi:hypothetical protein
MACAWRKARKILVQVVVILAEISAALLEAVPTQPTVPMTEAYCTLTEAYCTLTEAYCTLTEVFLTLTEVFPCFFLSCKANARVKLAKTEHGPHSSTLGCICIVRLLFVLFYVLFVCKCVLPPGDNPIAVNKYIISYHNLSL